MSSVAFTPVSSGRIPASRVVYWWLEGLRLWLRAPVKLTVMCLAPLAVEFLLQLIPHTGVALSKVLNPLVTAGILVGIDAMARGRPLESRYLVAGLRPERLGSLLKLNLWLLTIFATQVLAAFLRYGPGALEVVVSGQVDPELSSRAFAMTLILPGLVPATLLMLAMPLVLFDALGPTRAVVTSFQRMLAVPLATVLMLAIGAALLAVVIGRDFGFLLLVLVQPWSAATGYAAYRDLSQGLTRA